MHRLSIGRWVPLVLLLCLLLLFFGLGFNRYVSFTMLREQHALLLSWTQNHFFLSAVLFMVCYTLAVAISIPGAVFLTLAGGFLFGIFLGLVLVVFSATLGASILFFAVRTSLGQWFAQRASGGWVERMRLGFQRHAFSYLLTLRLLPLFPFWVVNIVSALLNVDTKTFIGATLIGIIPGAFVYVLLGNGLGQVFASDRTPNLGIIFEPKILGPLLVLAALSLISVLYPLFKKK